MSFSPRGLKDAKFDVSWWTYRSETDTLAEVTDPAYFRTLFDYDGMREWVRVDDQVLLILADCRAWAMVVRVDAVRREVELAVPEGAVVRRAIGAPPPPQTTTDTKRAATPATGRAA